MGFILIGVYLKACKFLKIFWLRQIVNYIQYNESLIIYCGGIEDSKKSMIYAIYLRKALSQQILKMSIVFLKTRVYPSIYISEYMKKCFNDDFLNYLFNIAF